MFDYIQNSVSIVLSVVIPLDSWGSLTNNGVYRLHRPDEICLEDSATTMYAHTDWIYQSRH